MFSHVSGPISGRNFSLIAKLIAAVFAATLLLAGPATAQPTLPGQDPDNVAPEDGVLFDPPDPPTKGPLVAELRLLTYNVYGVDQDNCETRATRFGEIVAATGTVTGRPFDIIGLQEYYEDHFFDFGTICNHNKLRDAARATGKYLNSDNTRFFRPIANNQHNGGVGLMTLHKIVSFDDWQWSSDTQGWPKAAEGFAFARIEIPGRDLTLDVYVVHLNSGTENGAARTAQLAQLADRIRALSATSGNPVFVMGDFNIGGPLPVSNPPGHPGYQEIIDVLGNPRDLWFSANFLADPTAGLYHRVRPVRQRSQRVHGKAADRLYLSCHRSRADQQPTCGLDRRGRRVAGSVGAPDPGNCRAGSLRVGSFRRRRIDRDPPASLIGQAEACAGLPPWTGHHKQRRVWP